MEDRGAHRLEPQTRGERNSPPRPAEAALGLTFLAHHLPDENSPSPLETPQPPENINTAACEDGLFRVASLHFRLRDLRSSQSYAWDAAGGMKASG